MITPWSYYVLDAAHRRIVSSHRTEKAALNSWRRRTAKHPGTYHVEQAAENSPNPLIKPLCEVASLLGEYRERVMKGEITGRLLEHDCAAYLVVSKALAQMGVKI